MLTRRRLLGGLVLAALVVLAVCGLAAWYRQPPGQRVAGTIPTGAGFNVSVTQSPSEARARLIAGRIAASGMPAFTRLLPSRPRARREGASSGASHQVVVGPYVSLEEAESAQHHLARQGFAARILVDESVRRIVRHDGVSPIGVSHIGAGANILLIAGAGRVAVVIELPVEPRRVLTRPLGERGLEIEVGPVPAAIESQGWNAPSGVALLERIAVEQSGTGEGRSIRTRIAMSASAQGSVRVEGRRLYIDLFPAETRTEPADVVRAAALSPEPAIEDYRVTIGPAVAKLDAIEPFVASAVGSPTPDVLFALEGTLQALEGWMQTVRPPRQWQDTHDTLVAAVGRASDAVSPAFAGDRAARAHEAFALRDAARSTLGD